MQLSRRSLLAGAVTAIALPRMSFAQDQPIDILQQLPGLKAAWARRYYSANEFDISQGAVEPSDETPHYLLVMMLEFESRAILTGIMNAMLNRETAGLITSRSPMYLEESTVEGGPEGNTLFAGDDLTLSTNQYGALLVWQMDTWAFLISANGETSDIQVTLNDIATFIAAQDMPETPVEIVAEGYATGGVFDLLPDVDDLGMLRGLGRMIDYDMMVGEHPILPTDATPAASPHVH